MNDKKSVDEKSQEYFLFSIISHDLRSLFNPLLAFSELLNEEYDELTDTQRREYASMINDSAKQIFTILENLLDWSRVHFNNVFKTEPINVKNAVYSVLNLLKLHLENKGLDAEIKIGNDIIIYADKMSFNSILRNIITNAIKFSNPGSKIIITSFIGNNEKIISVQNTGEIMKKETIINLNNDDFNLSSKGTKGETGTGLGLFICKSLLKANSADMRISAKNDEGTKVELIFKS